MAPLLFDMFFCPTKKLRAASSRMKFLKEVDFPRIYFFSQVTIIFDVFSFALGIMRDPTYHLPCPPYHGTHLC